MITVWHQSTARAIRKQSDPLHSNRSHGTLISYSDHSAQRCFKSNAPIVIVTWPAFTLRLVSFSSRDKGSLTMIFSHIFRWRKQHYFTQKFACSPQEKIIVEFIKMTPFKSLHTLDSETLNCPLFFRKILQVPQILWFSSMFCVFEPYPKMTVWFWEPIFSHWGQLRDSYSTITKSSNGHWCSRRKHDALSAWRWKLFEFEDQGKFNLFCLLENMQVYSVASKGQY